MTSSDHIEELMYDAHYLGIAESVLKLVNEFKQTGVRDDAAYELAFREALKELDNGTRDTKSVNGTRHQDVQRH
jgi:hypothetical protein